MAANSNSPVPCVEPDLTAKGAGAGDPGNGGGTATRPAPARAEGFAAVVRLDPSKDSVDASFLQTSRMLSTNASATPNKEPGKKGGKTLHAYSRLPISSVCSPIRLMSHSLNWTTAIKPPVNSSRRLCALPEGSLAEKAAQYLKNWREIQDGLANVMRTL